MEMKWIQTFLVAAETENMRKTAEQLYVTQPAVTKHIQRLEQYLQMSLFDRQGKSIRLSVAGINYLPHAKALWQQYETGLSAFDAWKNGFLKHLTIAVAPQIASSILPTIISDFMNEYPTIDVDMNVINSYEVAEQVQSGQTQVGLTRIETILPNILSETIMQEKVVLVAPFEENPFNEQQAFHKYRLITHNHPVYWDSLIPQIAHHYPYCKMFKVNQVEVTKRFIEQKLGISYLPYSLVEREVHEGRIQIIESETIDLPISETFVCTKVQTEEVKLFIDYLKSKIGK